MAEIKIERKKPIWPWILLIVIIAVAALVYFMNQDTVDDDIDDQDDVAEIDSDENVMDTDDSEISSAFVDSTDSYNSAYSRQESDRAMMDYRASLIDSTKIGNDLAFTKNTMSQLVTSVEIKANQFNINAQQYIKEIKQNMTANAAATAQQGTRMVKETASKIVDVLSMIQAKQFPGLSDDVMNLRKTVDELQVNVTLDKQRQKLQVFFNDAANLLNNMNI